MIATLYRLLSHIRWPRRGAPMAERVFRDAEALGLIELFVNPKSLERTWCVTPKGFAWARPLDVMVFELEHLPRCVDAYVAALATLATGGDTVPHHTALQAARAGRLVDWNSTTRRHEITPLGEKYLETYA